MFEVLKWILLKEQLYDEDISMTTKDHLTAQRVKNLPAMQETQEVQIQSLGWKDPLEKEMDTHSSVLAWRIPWTEEPGRLQPMGVTKSQTQRSD